MKAKIPFLICILCMTFALKAQVSLTYRVSYGSYAMKSVHEYQDYLLRTSGFPARIVTQFPGYINQKLMIGFPSLNENFKIYAGYETTGGRISLADYSGKVNMDIVMNGYQAGIHFDLPFAHYDKVYLAWMLDFGTTTTVMDLKQYLKVGEQDFKESYTFISQGLDVLLGLSVAYKQPRYTITGFVGAQKDFSKPFHLKDNKNVRIGTSAENYTKPDWSGVRTGMEFCYFLGKKGK